MWKVWIREHKWTFICFQPVRGVRGLLTKLILPVRSLGSLRRTGAHLENEQALNRLERLRACSSSFCSLAQGILTFWVVPAEPEGGEGSEGVGRQAQSGAVTGSTSSTLSSTLTDL
jgi:hypothetical protein